MTGHHSDSPTSRFQLNRAGVLNVWQYDEQVFDFEGGRLLLRGTNGAGKSKTLELLLPFCIDGDRQRMNATGRAQTALTWLMLDGVEERLRTGYVWVEFRRTDESGKPEFVTCGVGLRASRSSNSVSSWMFCSPQRVGADLLLEDADGPLSRAALTAAVPPPGRVFETARDYRAHVGRLLFGLDPGRYDDLLRLLYWLRQPQIGEEIDPKKIAQQLVQSLPELDADELAKAGSTLDELADFGEKLRRTQAAQAAIVSALDVYARYARGVMHQRAARLIDAEQEHRRLQRAARQQEREHGRLVTAIDALARELAEADAEGRAARVEMDALAVNPEEAKLEDCRALAEARKSAAARLQVAATQMGRALDAAAEAASSARGHAEETARHLDTDVEGIATLARRTALPLPSGFAGSGGAAAVLARPPEESNTAAQRWVEAHGVALDHLAETIAVKSAATREVRAAAVRHSQHRAAAVAATDASDSAAARADGLRASTGDLQSQAAAAARGWLAAVVSWADQPPSLALESVAAVRSRDIDDLIDDSSADDLPGLVAAEAATALTDLRRIERDRHSDRAAADRVLAETDAALAAARAETEPAPQAAPLPRDRDRDAGRAGAPLWRSVDFVEGVDSLTRAAVEAALQQSGVLDAWIDPDGALRDDAFDVVLQPGAPIDGPALDVVLRPVDDDRRIAPLLASIALVDRIGEGPLGVAAVGRDGSFRLGPLQGRAAKPTAQYVGAAARAAERARRIGHFEALRVDQEARLAEAAAAERAAAGAVALLEGWVAAVPPTRDLVRARDRLDAGRAALASAEGQAHAAEDAAAAARMRASQSLHELSGLGERHGVPVDVEALDRLSEELRDLGGRLSRHRDELSSLTSRVAQSVGAAARQDEAMSSAAEAVELSRQAEDEAGAQQHAYESLSQALSETLGELTVRRERARARHAEATRTQESLTPAVAKQREDLAVLAERRTQTRGLAGMQHQEVARAAAGVSRLRDVPGLLAAALGSVDEASERALASGASGAEGTGPAPELVALARTWAPSPVGAAVPDANAVLHMHAELATGQAASYEPTLSAVDEAYALVARDATTTVTLAELAVALTDRVEQQSQLLTSREREAFELVLLGSLGDELRRRLQEAHELVDGMNRLLHDIRTSQGIRVRLRWRIREDTPPEARDVTDLVARSSAALLPDERERLHRAMRQLLDLAADDSPDDGYAEHLRRALDYRMWHEFRVQYTRPGADDWLDLSRRSPLSQGEQKVACYLPLFAAAAAHFSSVAGATPQAPRFVLLDDAFPKIDARTHPLLFGLLVQLDLDFVVTSERLWGDHPELPALAIYEALRSPGEPGIAQFHYTWDGRALQAVGPS